MIKVTIVREHTHIKSFCLTGHADSGPEGHDLVCAAVSGISFGAVNAVFALCEIELNIDQAGDEGGYLEVTVPAINDPALLEKVSLLFEGMVVSLRTVERDYGQYISISEK
ncbi:ribosomal-processing cysteine protease Prp [Gracilibacillus caseinilyticus]|uniref:Ribosomal processing cysteine protease Prp n=1 Tax=Gracilibacillus caseinilyticus TaxID=2932256 RepID=A0ABY4ES93_9BACI|nr:ribosomal-processing cysteine protease Prp [Gracilibacillus caseinilyticus]UOQ47305.1 ribosomal-processing cysteine protease Prp [Gracilibacillus caseinilyticus]